MELRDYINQVHNGSMDWKTFSPNNSALGYDADIRNFMSFFGFDGMAALGFSGGGGFGYDADIMNFGGQTALGADGQPSPFDQKQLGSWLNAQAVSGAMTTFEMKAFWTAGGGGSPAPVDIVLFDTTFNPGTFTGGGDLQFTNSNGDTATIVGLTERQPGVPVTMKQLFNLTETEPFTTGFIRLRPKSVEQLDNSFSIVKESQYGASGTNSMAPSNYVDPYQFQLLRVDVPFNSKCSKKHGFGWKINTDQTGNGVNMVLFIPKTIDPTKPLSGENPIRQLNSGFNPQFFVPAAASGAQQSLQAIASHPQVKQLIASGIGKDMAVNLIKGGMIK